MFNLTEVVFLEDWGVSAKAGQFIKVGIAWGAEASDQYAGIKGQTVRLVAAPSTQDGEKLGEDGGIVQEARVLQLGKGSPWVKIEVEDAQAFAGLEKSWISIGIRASGSEGQTQLTLKGGPLARAAAMLAGEVGFQRWIGAASKEAAEAAIKEYCGVSSKRELDHNAEAGKRFRAIRAEYDVEEYR